MAASHGDPNNELFERSASADHDMEKGGGMRVNVDELLKKHAVRTTTWQKCEAVPRRARI